MTDVSDRARAMSSVLQLWPEEPSAGSPFAADAALASVSTFTVARILVAEAVLRLKAGAEMAQDSDLAALGTHFLLLRPALVSTAKAAWLVRSQDSLERVRRALELIQEEQRQGVSAMRKTVEVGAPKTFEGVALVLDRKRIELRTAARDVLTATPKKPPRDEELIRELGQDGESTNPFDFGLVCLLGLLGLRIFETVGADIDDLGEEHGHRVLRVHGKGGRIVLVPLPPAVSRAVDRAAGDRASGPLSLNRCQVRMDRHAATRRLRHLAGIAGVRLPRMHRHMLRHTFVTTMLDACVDLRDVQIAARHADQRTTMRYDRARKNLDRHPNYILAPTWPRAPDIVLGHEAILHRKEAAENQGRFMPVTVRPGVAAR